MASHHGASYTPSNLDSHPSLAASLEDFEAREFSPTVPDLPSQHSGFRSTGNVSSYQSSDSSHRRSDSPPAWRKAGSGWFKQQGSLSPSRGGYESREVSPEYHSAEDEREGEVTVWPLPSRIPLPESPTKGRSVSPSPDPIFGGGDARRVPPRDRHSTPQAQTGAEMEEQGEATPTQMNYIRFSTSLDVIQRTEPLEAAITYIRNTIHSITSSRSTLLLYTFGTLILYWLTSNLLTTPQNTPSPDLIKVAGLAQSFEPVIYYSEHGHAQIEELQDTGIAVWDLGESVRSTNMTSGPLITNQLDELSESMKTLALEMTRFFASVDADVDSILIVMDWAQRELYAIISAPPGRISSIWSNAHGLLTRLHLLPPDSPLTQTLLGATHAQRTKSTLQRTFHEFLGVLEESIENELKYSIRLFSLFEAVDKQFLNLQRTVIREQDQQERLENDFLSSLWTKVIGANALLLRKYEKNRDLLSSIRDRTVRNKHVLVEHNQRLLQLRSNLEILRRKLVSPLVRSQNSSTLGIEEQVEGLSGVYDRLRGSRDGQKRKMMELVYGAGSRRANLIGESVMNGRGIESR
ncbi:hypothetical protein LTR95_005612 [Oleoguttula sp. CCFEE 5521]